ncbi:DMT family transporter [Paramaledivibacter caminithermalis]|jgi:transporter family-2 protein|uniref:Transporter family-2 protein n=1 Tax=Paramaledivibacter caminithermalis (strain DSM 15212 / CIP 107654 / DViRD3) TaxID=1121301 RepID=A0A1M6P7W1_PARC5|nr:DMT family transporter [Paramaledivibacter caminithermalis]SHK04002.1 transporter family-2 protein [Paramaledivibacter caminithermalis DSM 15212]
MYKLFVVLSGILVALMVTCNGILSNYIGDYPALILIHGVGLITIIAVLILKKQRLPKLKGVPIYLLSAGALGVFMIFSNNICFTYLGISLTVALGLLGQAIASCIIDHFGLFGMEISKFQKEKIIGFILIFAGIACMVIY